MTRLLASVKNVREARLAMRYGADIIDLKNPSTGALGALPQQIIQQVVRAVARRRPVSATIGDLPADRDLVHAAVAAIAGTGVDYVKIGLLGRADWRSCLEDVSQCVPRGVALVAVLFADQELDMSVLDDLAKIHFRGAMLDTADKSRGRLRQIMGLSNLETFVRYSRCLGLLSGLAGSLTINDVPELLPLRADYLGFRTALCNLSIRESTIDPRAIRAVRACIPQAGDEGIYNVASSIIKPEPKMA